MEEKSDCPSSSQGDIAKLSKEAADLLENEVNIYDKSKSWWIKRLTVHEDLSAINKLIKSISLVHYFLPVKCYPEITISTANFP